MKVHEILTESKTQKAEAPKPRNFVAKNAINTGAGAHKDKKKAAKQGDVKHKKQAMAMESYPKHQDLSGVSTDKLKAYLAKQGQQQNPGEGNQVKRVRAELQRREQGVAEGQGHPSDNDMGTTTGGTKMTLAQWKQMWMKKMPSADFAALFRSPPSMSGSAIAYFDGWMNNPDARWDPIKRVAEGRIDEKAKSKAQQKFMGMVYAAKKGEKPASPEVAKVAKGMSKKSAKDYAQTKHKGKPEHVDEDATAGSTSAANVSVGVVYKNKKPKMQKPGTNALDMKGGNLMTGGSIKR